MAMKWWIGVSLMEGTRNIGYISPFQHMLFYQHRKGICFPQNAPNIISTPIFDGKTRCSFMEIPRSCEARRLGEVGREGLRRSQGADQADGEMKMTRPEDGDFQADLLFFYGEWMDHKKNGSLTLGTIQQWTILWYPLGSPVFLLLENDIHAFRSGCLSFFFCGSCGWIDVVGSCSVQCALVVSLKEVSEKTQPSCERRSASCFSGWKWTPISFIGTRLSSRVSLKLSPYLLAAAGCEMSRPQHPKPTALSRTSAVRRLRVVGSPLQEIQWDFTTRSVFPRRKDVGSPPRSALRKANLESSTSRQVDLLRVESPWFPVSPTIEAGRNATCVPPASSCTATTRWGPWPTFLRPGRLFPTRAGILTYLNCSMVTICYHPRMAWLANPVRNVPSSAYAFRGPDAVTFMVMQAATPLGSDVGWLEPPPKPQWSQSKLTDRSVNRQQKLTFCVCLPGVRSFAVVHSIFAAVPKGSPGRFDQI